MAMRKGRVVALVEYRLRVDAMAEGCLRSPWRWHSHSLAGAAIAEFRCATRVCDLAVRIQKGPANINPVHGRWMGDLDIARDPRCGCSCKAE